LLIGHSSAEKVPGGLLLVELIVNSGVYKGDIMRWLSISIFICFFSLVSVGQIIGQVVFSKETSSKEFGIYLLNEKKQVDILKTDIKKLKLQKKAVISANEYCLLFEK
jgi:hypothetical protein